MKSKKYITPTLTVVTFKAEQGFASSGAETMFLDLSIFKSEGYNDQAQQNWQEEENGSLFGNWL